MLVWLSEFVWFCTFPEGFFWQKEDVYILVYWGKAISMQTYNFYFIYCYGKTVVTFPDTKYRVRDKKKKHFKGFLHTLIKVWLTYDKSIFSLYHELVLMDTILWQTIWFTMICGFISSFKYALLSFDIIYHSSNPVSFLIKYHFLKSETDEIIYCEFSTFVILVFSLSNHL